MIEASTFAGELVLGSFSNEIMLISTECTFWVGFQRSHGSSPLRGSSVGGWRIEMQTVPFSYTFGWNNLVTNRTVGGENGYSCGNFIDARKYPEEHDLGRCWSESSWTQPPEYSVSGGPKIATSHSKRLSSFNNFTRKPSIDSFWSDWNSCMRTRTAWWLVFALVGRGCEDPGCAIKASPADRADRLKCGCCVRLKYFTDRTSMMWA